jgi:hypothetical protein
MCRNVLAEDGVAHADMPEHLQPVVDRIDQVLAESPAMNILHDLPPRAQEDSMRAALASIVDGEPVKVGELLHAAAESDPRIAESFEPEPIRAATINTIAPRPASRLNAAD